MSKFLIVRPMEENEKISKEEQNECWMGAGILFYLTKHLHLNLANTTRELSKSNNGANPATFMEYLCLIKYVMDTKNLCIKIKPTGNSNEPKDIVCFCNSNYEEDPVSRRSISRLILCMLGVSASW